jgi:hypothetical protein
MLRHFLFLWCCVGCCVGAAFEPYLDNPFSLESEVIGARETKPDVEKTLEVSEEKEEVISDIDVSFNRAKNALRETRRALEQAIVEARQAQSAAIRAVLSEEERDTLDDLLHGHRERLSRKQITADVAYLKSLLPILEKLKAIQSMTVLEGTARKEEDLPKPPKVPAVVHVDKHVFFEPQLDLDLDDELRLREVVRSYRSFSAYAGGKFCGGFHPDANIRLVTEHGMVQMLVCFSCHEVQIIDGKTALMVELEDDAYEDITRICSRGFRHRRPAAAEENMAEQSNAADSR